MPNPRANRPLTLDQVTADLKSLSQPAQALFDMMAGGLRGSAVGTLGAPGDIETLARMGVNSAGGSFNPAMPSRSGRVFQPVSEEPFFPSSEELAKRFAPTIPNGDPMRRKSAEPFEELGQFAPLPLSGKALKVIPYALGRGAGEVTKEAARMVNDAMLYGQGPLAKVTPQVQRMFIGPQAKVWNHGMAQVAESMEKAGADPVEIWQKTGTFRGADGKLRQEISDKPAQFFNADQIKQRAGEESEAIKELQGRLLTDPNQKDLFPKLLTEAKRPVRAEVKQRKEALAELHGPRTLPYRGNFAPIAFEHPELYEAYPELKKYLVSQGGGGGSARGSLMGENIDIYEAGLRGDPRSTMLHEMQHAIQGIEDFAPGGNPAMAFAQPEAMKILEEMRRKASTPMSFEEYADRYSHLANKEKGYEDYLKAIPGIVKRMDRELQSDAAVEYYKRLAGEAEARATQERMNMTPTERQENFPYSSYDVLEENLIVKPPKRDPFSEEGMAAGGLLKGVKAIRKGALSAERSMPARGALRFAEEPAGGPSVIKEKGGNWLSGSAEKAVGPLLQKGMINNREIPYGPEFDAAIRQRIEDLKQHASKPDYKGGAGRVVEHLERELENPRANEAAINKWVQSNLTNYIKKEMATPEDPVRRLAEQGITHMPANEIDFANAFLPEKLAVKRMNAGFTPQGLGESPAAQGWERITDELINVAPAIQHTRPLTPTEIRQGVKSTTETDPWLNKVDPNTPIYYPENMDSLGRDLGFDHIVDVLRADLAAGRIRPEQLSKVSMEQAVRRTYEYDQELAKKMAEARASAREGLPVHKEYPEGYRWIELNRPGAFAQESEAMGHSVRGYEPPRGHSDWIAGSGDEGSPGYGHGGWEAIKSGKAKVYSLIDPKGEPHVTVEVAKGKPWNERNGIFYDNPELEPSWAKFSNEESLKGIASGVNRPSDYIKKYPEWLKLNEPDLFAKYAKVFEDSPARISQIKGKQNRAPKEEYLPFVQDFVKGGKWSDVGDLRNTGLVRQDGKYMTQAEYDDYLLNELKPPEDGMKRGGSVHISDNPDTMMMEVGDKRMKDGGSEDDTKAFIGYPKLAKQARYARAVAPERGDVNLLKDPQTYAFVMGMLGEAPDELGFTALDSDEQKQKIKAAGEKGFVTGAVSQLGPLAQLGKKAGKKAMSLAGEGINERLLSGQSLTPFINTPAPAMFAVPPGALNSIRAAGRASHQEQAATRAAIDAEIAEQMAKLPARSRKANEAMGLYHPVGGGIKLSKPTRGMHSTTVADPEFNPPEIGIITPEQLVKEEAALFPLVGDRAAGGRYLTHVGESELEVPVRLTAGPRYMDANYNRLNPDESAAWESGLGRVTALGRQAERAGEGGRPVYGIYTAGSGTNTDFNVMGANALIQQIPYSKITKKAEREFDRAMKVGTEEFPPIPNWPGIRSPEAKTMLLDKSNGIVRTKLFGVMGKESFQSKGFPDVPATRKAIIEPELLDIPTNQAGFRLARMDPTGRIIENPIIPSDYPAAMAGKVAGQLDVPADYKDIFQSHFDARRLLGQPVSGDYYSFSRAHPIQYADEEWLNRLMEQRLANERKIKEGEYKDGGEITIKPKKDGQKFKPGKKSDPVLKHGQAVPLGKNQEVDLSQIMPMMAGGGEVNADDLILEERPL